MKKTTLLHLILTASLLGSCGIIHKVKVRHSVRSDSTVAAAATQTTITHIAEQVQGTVPYQVSSITAPIPAAGAAPAQYETADYTLRYTPPGTGHEGSIAIQGKKALVPVTISKTTDVKETAATTSSARTTRSEAAVTKDKKTNTVPVWLLLVAGVLLAAAVLYATRARPKLNSSI